MALKSFYKKYRVLRIEYRVKKTSFQLSVIGYQFFKISVIATSDLSERGNLCSGLLRHFVPPF
jgi:hypothetical protein